MSNEVSKVRRFKRKWGRFIWEQDQYQIRRRIESAQKEPEPDNSEIKDDPDEQ